MKKILLLSLIFTLLLGTTSMAMIRPLEGVDYPQGSELPVESVEGTEYTTLEILEGIEGSYFTRANGHYYSIKPVFDDREEYWYFDFYEDDKPIHRFDKDYGPCGVVQLNGDLFIGIEDSIYRYHDGTMSLIAQVDGWCNQITTNGKEIYVSCVISDYWTSYKVVYYKVSIEGDILHMPKGNYVYCYYQGFSINRDGDRMAFLPEGHSGVAIRRDTGEDEYQRSFEDWEFDDNDYTVYHVLYYNNCLLANAKGSLVYYDQDNKRHVLMGDMKGDRIYREGHLCQPGQSAPIETGTGTDVRLGYVIWWTIGDDGCIYGTTMETGEKYHPFKLTIPDSIKGITTYKKKK